jgi:hypothetical protein
MFTQISGSVSKTAASRTAMSGVTGERPFTIAETCFRVTPSAWAARLETYNNKLFLLLFFINKFI